MENSTNKVTVKDSNKKVKLTPETCTRVRYESLEDKAQVDEVNKKIRAYNSEGWYVSSVRETQSEYVYRICFSKVEKFVQFGIITICTKGLNDLIEGFEKEGLFVSSIETLDDFLVKFKFQQPINE
jgi:hypothetical protein